MTGDNDFLESRNLKHYLEQISKYPAFSEKEERILGERIREGDAESLEKLIKANLRFVVSYAKKYRGMGLSLLDLIHEGNVGLIEAARRFDPSKKVRFISYAVWWIRQAIIHALSHYSRAYNIPQKISDAVSLMKKKRIALKAALGREPTRQEIAREMDLDEAEIEELELLEERNLSLSEGQGLEDDFNVESRLYDANEPSVEYQVIKASIEQQLREIISQLDEKEQIVLKLRYGLEDDRPKTLQEIGNMVGLTRERIRQIEQKAMHKLARSQKLQQLRGYLN